MHQRMFLIPLASFVFYLFNSMEAASVASQTSPPPVSSPKEEKISAARSHGFSIFGKLKYPKDFSHLSYVNPQAPKGGTINYGTLGSFDSLNVHIVKGNSASMMALTFARLMIDTYDRAGECYAYAAESMEVDPDRRYVIFYLNPKGHFNNGDPITPEDILWTFETMRTKGHPMYRSYFKDVSKAEKVGDYGIKFHITNPKNNELPLILGQIPVLSKKYYTQGKIKFEETTLTPPPASGPYEAVDVQPGRSITYKRVKNWWGENLPSQRGLHNFDTFKVVYYMDQNALFEAFKSGEIDLRSEASAKTWMTGYTFPAYTKGWVKRAELPETKSSRTVGIFLNLRRPALQDRRVRQALTLAFDFDWANKNLFYGLYQRNQNFFANSDYASTGVPEGEELALLEAYRAQLHSEIFTQTFTLPTYGTETAMRTNLLQAKNLLVEAGYQMVGQKMVNPTTKEPLSFETIIFDPTIEKIFLNFAATLSRIGVTLNIRKLDSSTYQERIDNLDYDMVYSTIPQSASIGNEQRDYFGSEKADMPGTRNHAGIKNPVIDALIEQIINVNSYHELVTVGRALDRVLLFQYALIPSWHRNGYWVAYWDRLGFPDVLPVYAPLLIETWWFDQEKDAKLKKEMLSKQTTHSSPDADHSNFFKKIWKYILNLF